MFEKKNENDFNNTYRDESDNEMDFKYQENPLKNEINIDIDMIGITEMKINV